MCSFVDHVLNFSYDDHVLICSYDDRVLICSYMMIYSFVHLMFNYWPDGKLVIQCASQTQTQPYFNLSVVRLSPSLFSLFYY